MPTVLSPIGDRSRPRAKVAHASRRMKPMSHPIRALAAVVLLALVLALAAGLLACSGDEPVAAPADPGDVERAVGQAFAADLEAVFLRLTGRRLRE